MKLLAPNGKPTNLTPEQYRLVRTPEFKAWFGDWENFPETSSKVVDENGEPLVVYHGSGNDFNIFKIRKKKKYKDATTIFSSNPQDEYYETGAFFSNDYETSNYYSQDDSGFIRPFFLNIKNPFLNEAENQLWNKVLPSIFDKYFQNEEKYDGIIVNNINNVGRISNEYVVIKPNQIKLADGTNTTFDSNNPDIRYKNGGIITEKAEILYHGTSLNRANKILKDGFDLERQSDKTKQGHKKAISFTSSYQEAKEHSDWAAEKFNDKPAIISINIPFEILSGKSFFDMDMDMEKAYKLFELKKIDGISFCDYETGDGCEEMEVAIFNIEKLNQNKLNFTIEYSLGGELTLTSEQVENKLGRKLHWWNDDVVTINGANYKKVFLRPEYKIEEEFQYGIGGAIEPNFENIALFKYHNSFTLYNTIEKKVYGYIGINKSEGDNYYVGGVAAEYGYGHIMYELAMSYVYPKGLMPTRDGDIRSGAVNVWERFLKRKDVEKKRLTKKDADFSWIFYEDYGSSKEYGSHYVQTLFYYDGKKDLLNKLLIKAEEYILIEAKKEAKKIGWDIDKSIIGIKESKFLEIHKLGEEYWLDKY